MILPMRAPGSALAAAGRELAVWPARRWLVALLAASVAALAIGIPTGVVPTPFYTRMTPVTWWDYPLWFASSALVGLIVGTYVRAGQRPPEPSHGGRTLVGGVASAFAVGCPICNKLVVALIGVSGALELWAPLQPLLGSASVGLLVFTLGLRLRLLTACRVRPAAPAPA